MPTSRCLNKRDSVVQVEKTQQAVKKEQSLASQLEQEMKAVNSSAEEQVQLEQQRVQATEKERALVEKSLQAERQKVSCLHGLEKSSYPTIMIQDSENLKSKHSIPCSFCTRHQKQEHSAGIM